MPRRCPTTYNEEMRTSTSVLCMFLLLAIVIFSHSARAADTMVEANYRWLASDTMIDGQSSTTFTFTVSNTGNVDFTGLNLLLHMSPPVSMTNANTKIAIGYLAAGESLTVTQSILFHMPVDNDTAVVFLGEAQDEYDTRISTPISIEKEGAL